MRIFLIVAAAVGIVLAYRYNLPGIMPLSVAGIAVALHPAPIRHHPARITAEPPAATAPATVRKKAV